MAKCNRLIGLQSTFAPQSAMLTFPPDKVGNIGHSAGRDTLDIRPSFVNAPTSNAPVLPALTKASYSSLQRKLLYATTIEESVFCLNASVGLSSFVITSDAFKI